MASGGPPLDQGYESGPAVPMREEWVNEYMFTKAYRDTIAMMSNRDAKMSRSIGNANDPVFSIHYTPISNYVLYNTQADLKVSQSMSYDIFEILLNPESVNKHLLSARVLRNYSSLAISLLQCGVASDPRRVINCAVCDNNADIHVVDFVNHNKKTLTCRWSKNICKDCAWEKFVACATAIRQYLIIVWSGMAREMGLTLYCHIPEPKGKDEGSLVLYERKMFLAHGTFKVKGSKNGVMFLDKKGAPFKFRNVGSLYSLFTRELLERINAIIPHIVTVFTDSANAAPETSVTYLFTTKKSTSFARFNGVRLLPHSSPQSDDDCTTLGKRHDIDRIVWSESESEASAPRSLESLFEKGLKFKDEEDEKIAKMAEKVSDLCAKNVTVQDLIKEGMLRITMQNLDITTVAMRNNFHPVTLRPLGPSRQINNPVSVNRPTAYTSPDVSIREIRRKVSTPEACVEVRKEKYGAKSDNDYPPLPLPGNNANLGSYVAAALKKAPKSKNQSTSASASSSSSSVTSPSHRNDDGMQPMGKFRKRR